MIESLARIPSLAHIASEFRTNEPVVNPNALHFAISQSGETADTLSALKEIQRRVDQFMALLMLLAHLLLVSVAKVCIFTQARSKRWLQQRRSLIWSQH